MLCMIATGSIFGYVMDADIEEGICPIALPTSTRGSFNKVSKEVIGHRALGKRSPYTSSGWGAVDMRTWTYRNALFEEL